MDRQWISIRSQVRFTRCCAIWPGDRPTFSPVPSRNMSQPLIRSGLGLMCLTHLNTVGGQDSHLEVAVGIGAMIDLLSAEIAQAKGSLVLARSRRSDPASRPS